ncbi:DUF3106 domain-containing protein [Cognatilysobacter bugurensis]|uniref:DUF3106 domain-containing protein n=1 Tax=Cognatilysobacter bugurensis TaxID=543356 RepID=A0A918WBD1_9GAMM|nr:DUF3106 domain-containing protein [Lysobacter bugurensis]GHA89659.1 hypothetical protein GCM10007067_29420 [Lysobacter bugurensis]
MTDVFQRASRFAVVAALLAGSAMPAFGQSPPALPSWEQLTPAQRELLIAPVRERWNAEPAQRRRMLAHAERWQSLSPEQRRRARHGVQRWQQMEPAEREHMRALFAHLRRLPEADRAAFMARWRAMSEEQKRSWAQVHPTPTGEKRERRER